MSDQTVAASSPAEMADPFNGESPSRAEFDQWRTTGELPERFKPAEPAEAAPVDAPEETAESETEQVESAPESEPEETQEQHKGSGAEKRIKQLLAKTKELERRLAEKQDVKPEPSPAQQQYTRPKPTSDGKDQNGNPYTSYDDFIEDLADWKAEQRLAAHQREQFQRAQAQEIQAKAAEAKARYGDDFDEVVEPTAQTIRDNPSIPLVVKQLIAESDVLPDLVYTLGSDSKEFEAFLKLPPGKQLRYIASIEAGIHAESSAEPEPERNSKGQFTAAPEKQQTKAPKPPSPVNSGGNSRAFDVSDESLSPEEWARQRNAQLAKKR